MKYGKRYTRNRKKTRQRRDKSWLRDRLTFFRNKRKLRYYGLHIQKPSLKECLYETNPSSFQIKYALIGELSNLSPDEEKEVREKIDQLALKTIEIVSKWEQESRKANRTTRRPEARRHSDHPTIRPSDCPTLRPITTN